MSEKKKKVKANCTSIGGQAVLEGVMMMGSTCMATAVRDPDGEIQIEAKRLNKSPAARRAGKIPFVRGIVSMVNSLIRGTSTLMRSAEVYGEEEEATRAEKWFAKKFNMNLMNAVSAVSVFIGVVLAVVLFLVLPNLAVSGLKAAFPSLTGTVWEYLILGVIKLAIFFAYLGIILVLKDIRRLYMYHGAEHKTITCYEKGLELTPENAMGCSRLHARCGTSFMFIVLAINILVISLVNWGLGVSRIDNGILQFLAKIGIEIVLLPVIAGISYEVLKFVAKFDNKFVNIFKAPGYFMQKVFTTREPTADMLEVAIAAFKKVLEMDADPEMEEAEFVTGGVLSQKLKATKDRFAAKGIDESDAEWIYSLVLDVKRSELADNGRMITPAEAKKIREIEEKRLAGRPLWYIIGDVDFYGCKIKVDERVLIPRPETEQLAEIAIKTIEDGDKVLDMCTGSGCIAIAIAKGCADKHVSVSAADVSDAALMLAKENAVENNAMVHFIRTDLFDNIRGRYNVIVCNPPYIKSSEITTLSREVRDYEPRIALDGGDDGLDVYRRIAKEINRYMARGGMLILECGEGQATEILKIFSRRDYAIVIKDLYGVDRFLKIAF
ncbi:MAG: peptide chain release factor N(5)-glutamine methyltransferase [Clostridia bacterium]|nr:peptide chain release factor N(5)-glutamine methyltransferase [Clostridia bacterium]